MTLLWIIAGWLGLNVLFVLVMWLVNRNRPPSYWDDHPYLWELDDD